MERSVARHAPGFAARGRKGDSAEMQHRSDPPVAAVIFDRQQDVDLVLAGVVGALRGKGIAVAGQLQHFGARLPSGKRSMWLEDIATGTRRRLDNPRGTGALGCTLDADALTRAACDIRAAIARRPALLVVNRFGCSEAFGSGIRAEIAEALCLGLRTLIAVRADFLPDWEGFLGQPARTLPPEVPVILDWVRASAPRRLVPAA